jgi:hypothetical protein
MSSSTPVADRIALTLPAESGLRAVATLVLGGIGSRLDLPYERVDDLQLAVLSVLAATDLEQVTIEVEIDDDRLEISVGPLPEGAAADRGLRRVVERLVDGVGTTERPALTGGSEEWIALRLSRAGYDAS